MTVFASLMFTSPLTTVSDVPAGTPVQSASGYAGSGHGVWLLPPPPPLPELLVPELPPVGPSPPEEHPAAKQTIATIAWRTWVRMKVPSPGSIRAGQRIANPERLPCQSAAPCQERGLVYWRGA